MDIIANKKYPIKGIKFNGESFNIPEETKSKLTRSFIRNNFWFSIGTLFDFIKNGFKLDKTDIIYKYFKDKDNKDDFQDTFTDALQIS